MSWWPSFRAALETARPGTRGHLEAFLGSAAGTSEPRRPPRGSGPREPLDLRPYGVAVLMVAAALGVAFPLAQVFDVPNAPLVFIAPIVVSAVRHGLAPSLLATTLATLTYTLFLLPPRVHPLLPAAALHATDRRPIHRRRVRLLRGRGARHQRPRGPRPRRDAG